MFYIKDVLNMERVLRIIMGLVGLAYAAMNWVMSGLAVGVGIMGAMVRRKLDKGHS